MTPYFGGNPSLNKMDYSDWTTPLKLTNPTEKKCPWRTKDTELHSILICTHVGNGATLDVSPEMTSDTNSSGCISILSLLR